jgi:hypothetical protein
MKIVTSREFLENQKNYLELAKQERVIIRQGNKQSFLILPINESEETDLYFSDPYIRSQIEQGMQDIKAGKINKVKTKEELNNLLNSL